MNKPISWWHLTSIGLALLVVPAGGLADAADSKAAPLPLSSEVESGRFLGPVDVVASRDGQMLFVAAADAGQILVVKADRGSTERVIDMPAEPTGLVLSTDGRALYVTCAAPEGTVVVVDVAAATIRDEIAVGHWPVGPAISPDGSRLYVCNRFDNNVEVIDTKTMKSVVRIPVTREPLAIAMTPDGESAFVINHLPNERANSGNVAAVVTVIDTASHETKTIQMPNGSTVMRGICVSPDGRYVFATHLLARYQMPTTQVERGWMNTNALSVIDARRKELINTVLLDDMDLGASDPWGVAATADGKTVCVTHAGTHELSVIDAAGLLDRLLALPSELPAGVDRKNRPRLAADVPNDLTFLAGLRRRIRLDANAREGRPARSYNVNGPRGLTIIGSRVFVAAYFTDNLAVADLDHEADRSESTDPVRTIALGGPPATIIGRRGEMLFHDATLCFQQWQSCASCHPDGRMDALNWDLMNDGLGSPKNARSLILAHQTPPSMSLGVLADAEAAVGSQLTHQLFAVSREDSAAAIEAYLTSLQPVSSPYLVRGQLSSAAQRGKRLFFDQSVNCAKCHHEPLYTDMKKHDVGSRGRLDRHDEFDTPTLIECWRTAPYLHDGRFLTVKQLLTKGRHGFQDCGTGELSEQQLQDLVTYVLSL